MRRIIQAPMRVATLDTRAVKPPPLTVKPIYTSPEWRGLVRRLIAQRGRRCEQCGRTSRGGKQLRIFGDHIRELRDGGAPLDEDNCQLLCGSCHTNKTLAERGRRMAERPVLGPSR